MATARKLPSGKYRVRAFIGTDSKGKKITKSFTANTKKDAELMASQFLSENHTEEKTEYTFGYCLDSYINARENVLSPTTFKDYTNRAKSDYDLIRYRRIMDLDSNDIQYVINEYAKNHSPKSTKNFTGLITATFKEFRPNYALRVAVPQKVKKKVELPSEDDIKALLDYFHEKDIDMSLAILLAIYCPMRRSEISALRVDDLTGNVIHVHSAMVLDKNKKWVIKTTKTVAGDRYIELPEFICEMIRERDGFAVPVHPDNISCRFIRARDRLGLKHFTFHSLRHYSASFQHSIGIADEYIMSRGGWSSDATLKEVYRHALDEETKRASGLINDKLSQIYT